MICPSLVVLLHTYRTGYLKSVNFPIVPKPLVIKGIYYPRGERVYKFYLIVGLCGVR